MMSETIHSNPAPQEPQIEEVPEESSNSQPEKPFSAESEEISATESSPPATESSPQPEQPKSLPLTREQRLQNFPFKGMIFEGGGTAGIGHVGAVRNFEKLGILNKIKYFVGSSAGAIAAGALSVGADSQTLEDILFNTDFHRFQDDSRGFVRDIYRLVTRFGWYKGDELYKWYGEVLTKLRVSPDITFQQVYEQFGNFLIITSTDINLGTTVYMDLMTTPDMPIRQAVKRSSLLPLVFQADSQVLPTQIFENNEVKVKNLKHYFVDGGLLNNYPIGQLDHLLSHYQVIGFKLLSTKELAELKINGLAKNNQGPDHIVDYINMLYSIIRNQALKLHVDQEDYQRTVKIDVGTISSTEFDMSDQDKSFLISQGEKASQDYLDNFDLDLAEEKFRNYYQQNEDVCPNNQEYSTPCHNN